jgi:hypothetical protein
LERFFAADCTVAFERFWSVREESTSSSESATAPAGPAIQAKKVRARRYSRNLVELLFRVGKRYRLDSIYKYYDMIGESCAIGRLRVLGLVIQG